MARGRKNKNTNKNKPWWILLGILLAVIVYANWGQMNNRPGLNDKQSVTQEMHISDRDDEEIDEDEGMIEKVSNLFSLEKINKSSKNKVALEKNKAKNSNEKTILPVKETARPTVKGKAKMAILLDDFGYSNGNLKEYNSLPIPLTYAVLPYHNFSTEAAKSGHAAGKEIMVHLPMESISNNAAEKGTIRTTMTNSEIRGDTIKAIDSIPYAVGINNHQGSKASADERVVSIIMDIVKQRGLFFFDSRTTAKSLILPIARKSGVHSGTNDLFIDNDSNVNLIEGRLEQAANIALNSNEKYIIVIGHDRPNTAKAIKNMYKKLQAKGIEFVYVRSLLY